MIVYSLGLSPHSFTNQTLAECPPKNSLLYWSQYSFIYSFRGHHNWWPKPWIIHQLECVTKASQCLSLMDHLTSLALNEWTKWKVVLLGPSTFIKEERRTINSIEERIQLQLAKNWGPLDQLYCTLYSKDYNNRNRWWDWYLKNPSTIWWAVRPTSLHQSMNKQYEFSFVFVSTF